MVVVGGSWLVVAVAAHLFFSKKLPLNGLALHCRLHYQPTHLARGPSISLSCQSQLAPLLLTSSRVHRHH